MFKTRYLLLKKNHASLTKISLMIFLKLTAVHLENQTKTINAVSGRQVAGRTSSWQVFSYVPLSCVKGWRQFQISLTMYECHSFC